LRVLNEAFDQSLKPEERAALPLAGGIMQHGYQCGMIWGATLAAGAQAYRFFGPGPLAESRAIIAAQRIVKSFHTQNKNINCLEITNIDRSSTTLQMIMFFLMKGGAIGCVRMASKYAKIALKEINSALSEKCNNIYSPPISCASLLAQKMGASDMQTVMAAGFAGGIGLCGGACGALGAAIWINRMNSHKEQPGKIGFNDPKATDTIERFIKNTNYKFECSEIVGRKFDNINDHTEFIKNGGCDKLINALTQL